MNKRFFTILELIIAISILSIVSVTVFWRLDLFLKKQKFEHETRVFLNFLKYARMLAINSKADWQIRMLKRADGWNLALYCRENPDLNAFKQSLLPWTMTFDGKEMEEIYMDFTSSGQIFPVGNLRMIPQKESFFKEIEIQIPQFFLIYESTPTQNLTRNAL